jgi:uncharacterized protein YnzC (UPF0291/DUF896 family)
MTPKDVKRFIELRDKMIKDTLTVVESVEYDALKILYFESFLEKARSRV